MLCMTHKITSIIHVTLKHLSLSTTKPTKWHMHPAKTQISLGIHPVWSESSLCAQWVAKDPRFLHAVSEDLVDIQADLSLRWAHISFCWFCQAVTHLLNSIKFLDTRFKPPNPDHPETYQSCLSFPPSLVIHCKSVQSLWGETEYYQ